MTIQRLVYLVAIAILAGSSVACGPSRQDTFTIDSACAQLREPGVLGAAARVAIVNRARALLSERAFIGGDREILRALKYDSCELLVANSPDYQEVTGEREQLDLHRQREEMNLELTQAAVDAERARQAALKAREREVEREARARQQLEQELLEEEAQAQERVAQAQLRAEQRRQRLAAQIDSYETSIADAMRQWNPSAHRLELVVVPTGAQLRLSIASERACSTLADNDGIRLFGEIHLDIHRPRLPTFYTLHPRRTANWFPIPCSDKTARVEHWSPEFGWTVIGQLEEEFGKAAGVIERVIEIPPSHYSAELQVTKVVSSAGKSRPFEVEFYPGLNESDVKGPYRHRLQ